MLTDKEKKEIANLKDGQFLPSMGYSAAKYSSDYGNCKHFYLSNIGSSINGYGNIDKFAEMIDELAASKHKVTFGVNITNYVYIKRLKSKFTMISCVAVPTGYMGNFQYHAIFFANTDCRSASTYKKRFKENGIGKLSSVITKEKLCITKKTKEKILAYKSKKWLTKYLDKLINGETH